LITRQPENGVGYLRENIQKDSDFLKNSKFDAIVDYKKLEEFFLMNLNWLKCAFHV
jgi:hypothetical protein